MTQRVGTLPNEADTLAAMQAALRGGNRELETLDSAMRQADLRGGHAPEIATLLSASSPMATGVELHGFTLTQPSFGALQVLDEIGSPLLVGGTVKLGQIAAALCVLEDAEKCWAMLSKSNGVDLFNSHVWNRTKHLKNEQATALAGELFTLIRRACGQPEAEAGSTVNPPEAGPVQPADAAPDLMPAGSPPSSTGFVPTTVLPSTMPSGVFLPPLPGSSSMPAPSAPGALPPVLAPLTAPASPPSVPIAGNPRPPGLTDAAVQYEGVWYASRQALREFLMSEIPIPTAAS